MSNPVNSMSLAEYRKAVSKASSEEDLQRELIALAKQLGGTVMQTSRRGTQGICPNCKKDVKVFGRDGMDRGVGDLLLRDSTCPVGIQLNIEVKGPRTPISAEQHERAARGEIVIVRTADEFLRAWAAMLDACGNWNKRKALWALVRRIEKG